MTDLQEAREQMAREFIERWKPGYADAVEMARVVALIASTEVRVLKEAIKVGEREAYELAPQHDGGQQLAVRMILEAQRGFLRQLQERTP